MAKCSGSQLCIDWFGFKTDIVDVSDWSKVKGNSSSNGCQKRADIVHAIIHNKSLNHLERILGSGWDVNEILRIPDHNRVEVFEGDIINMPYMHRTALGEAARRGWTGGVKMLLDAGAKCIAHDLSQYPITLALLKYPYPCDIIELLIQHGADPNYHGDHYANIPLLRAIRSSTNPREVRHVQLMLEHGANPNIVSSRGKVEIPLSEALQTQESAALFKLLISFGADLIKAWPLIHSRLTNYLHPYALNPRSYIPKFIEKKLDLLFLHGHNIYMENDIHKTLLGHAVEHNAHSNNIRWLIRHGADTTRITLSMALDFTVPWFFPDTPLILLQAGVRVFHGVMRQLQCIELEISKYLQGNKLYDQAFDETIKDILAHLKMDESAQHQRMLCHQRKTNFPEFLSQQMADLQEFSDVNLNVYPEITPRMYSDKRERWQNHLDMIHTLVQFQSQPQSLQWSCLHCLRENLVSLQPSVVKSLPIPAMLKRYILCHGI